MKVDVNPGVYVVAVSGGVDSMVLLHLLVQKDHKLKVNSRKLKDQKQNRSLQTFNFTNFQLIVAHYDHGIREDSFLDRELVQKTASDCGLPFVYDEGNLGPKASEAVARTARYKFLDKVKTSSGADAIITAHHQDDLVETAILNMLRGTGRRGLTSLKSSKTLIRPLLNFNKAQIVKYAKDNHLAWREDSTNSDEKYLRNRIRHSLLPKLTKAEQTKLLEIINDLSVKNNELDSLLKAELAKHSIKKTQLYRNKFIAYPHNLAKEIMAAWLLENGINDYSSATIERLVRTSKTQKPNTKADINKIYQLLVNKNDLIIEKHA